MENRGRGKDGGEEGEDFPSSVEFPVEAEKKKLDKLIVTWFK